MAKRLISIICIWGMVLLSGCTINNGDNAAKIGVSIGAGSAVRWELEAGFMEEAAKSFEDMEIDIRFNRKDDVKTQNEECRELIDSGIDVLIIMPRNVNDVGDVVDYAKEHDVKIISYARAISYKDIDLFVGCDTNKIGQLLGQYLAENVDQGDYILLKGDPNDYNSELQNAGAMRYIEPIKDDINIILDADVAGWSTEVAKDLVKEALIRNQYHVDAILAPNDAIAGACVEVLDELGIHDKVYITGMDAELDAVRRIVQGKQSVSVYIDLKELASTAVQEAYKMAKGETVDINATFDNKTESDIDAHLVAGKLITNKNIDKILIDSGCFTNEQVYGE